MDNDGDVDVVLGQMHTSADKRLLVLRNLDGRGEEWSSQTVATGGIHDGVVVDVDKDGDVDIYGANWTGNPPVRLWVTRTVSERRQLPLDRWGEDGKGAWRERGCQVVVFRGVGYSCKNKKKK